MIETIFLGVEFSLGLLSVVVMFCSFFGYDGSGAA